MFYLLEAMQQRLEFFFSTQSILVEDALAGDKVVTVDTVEQFGAEGLRKDFKNCLLWDSTTTGKLIPGGFEGADNNIIKDVAADKIFLKNPLTRDFLTSNDAIITRAPAGIKVEKIVLGDVRVNAAYPMISIIPRSKSIDFTTLSGSTDSVKVDFTVYVKDDDTQDAMGRMMKLADSLEWVLMTNQHIYPTNSQYNFETTSKAHVKSVNYGTIEKGSEFIKAATLSWEADMYFWRNYFSAQNSTLGELPLNFTPIQ
jgi:hypothetical protein